MLAPTPAIVSTLDFLQAGGGGGFGGGGGGGGGGDNGGGEGIFWILYWLLRLAIEVPVIGVPLIVAMVVIFLVGTRRGWWKHQERTIARARPERRAHASSAVAGELRALDPAFDERTFLARVEAAFKKAQSAWCAQELEPLRPFVSDGVFERFSLQIEEQREDGWRQGMDELACGPLSLLHVESGPHFDTLSVRIDFSSDIHKLDLKTQARIAGSELPRTEFAECWSFVRRRGARTPSRGGLMEGACPNCGAPLAMNQSARCGQCECLVRSGQFDWVLAEITQMSEWRATRAAAIPGLSEYAARDPGFDVQLLEDRASIAFWRKCAADRAGDAAPLSRLATASFCESYGEALAASSPASRVLMTDCAVGSVNTIALLAGPEQDRAVVEVVWDGRRSVADPKGRRTLETQRRLRRTLFVFTRKSGAATRLEETFTSATCRSCGVRDTGGTRPDCPYCGAPRTGDASAWLVSKVTDRGAADAETLLQEILALQQRPAPAAPAPSRPAPVPPPPLPPAPESASGLLQWSAALVRADGVIEERERRAVHGLAQRLRIAPERANAVLDGGREIAGPVARHREEAHAWYGSLVELALEDGSLSRVERMFLSDAARGLGVSDVDSERVIEAARSRLYGESREAHRALASGSSPRG